MSFSRKTSIVAAIIVVIASVGIYGLWSNNLVNEQPYVDRIQNLGYLPVLTRNAPTTYFEGRNGPTGIEYDLISSFAKFLGVEPKFIIKDTISEVTDGLSNGEGVVAAAGLSKTDGRSQRFLFGPAYQEVEQQVVCRRGGKIPTNKHELKNVQLLVSTDTSYVESLQNLQKEIPDVNWRADKQLDTEQLLEMVWKQELDCTIADSNIVAINRRYFPELVVAFNLTKPQSLAWLLPKDADDLQTKIDEWLNTYRQQGNLDDALERYYGFIELFDYVDNRKFRHRVKRRLPKYRLHFMHAAAEYDLPWTLLAAQSYQESHWRPRAKSPTGVRGMMMLTLPTAHEMGVKSRLNAKESILGGARYLSFLKRRIPPNVSEPDRTWMALAAYNVGLGHIHDAREITEEMGKDPDKWADLSETLPLLSQKKYYKDTRHGYARGSEPVTYVSRIRDFKDLLDNTIAGNSVGRSSNKANM